MKRLRPLSHSLALLAATHMSLAPVFIPMAHADIQSGSGNIQVNQGDDALTGDDLTKPTYGDDGKTVSDDDTTVTTVTDKDADITDIIKALTSSDVAEVQARYKELLALIKTKKAELKKLTDAKDIKDAKAEIVDLNNLSKAFKAIIKGFEDSGTKTVVSKETTTDPETGDKITRTTYSDGSYTETVEPGDKTDYGDDGYGNSDGDGGSGGGGDFLKKMLENPIVQGLITGLLQKLMSGGLGSLNGLLSGLFGGKETPNGDTLLGKVCSGGKCSSSDYGTPSPASKGATDTNATGDSTTKLPFQDELQGVPPDLSGGVLHLLNEVPVDFKKGTNGRIPGRN